MAIVIAIAVISIQGASIKNIIIPSMANSKVSKIIVFAIIIFYIYFLIT